MKISSDTYKALSVDTFVAFDIETTGLDSDKDEIIELGLVRMVMGKVDECYNQLFNPNIPIPKFITQLTGISSNDCVGKPSLKEKFPEIIEFMGNNWIVAHNADFDFNFMQKVWKQFGPDFPSISSERILDTLELSRILVPWISNHRLETVAEFFDVTIKPEHRALSDAEATAMIFQEQLSLVLSLDIRIIKLINRILDGASDGLRFFFERVESFIAKYKSEKKRKTRKGNGNIIGDVKIKPDETKTHKLEQTEIDCFFNPNGYLSKVIPKYENRRQQQEMARLVGKAFNQEAFLVAEAGTGVGKSLAYLVPAILWATQNSGAKVIVSTHTKTLQEQLFSKELPMLQKVIDNPFSAVLLKGRSNYLCLRRWENLILQMGERFSLSQRRKLLPLAGWIYETQTGDIDENSGFGREYNMYIWSQLNSEEGHCKGSQCEHESNCFLQKVRRASRSAHVAIINHSLLFSDLISDHSALGEYDTLIVDEAHQIESVASKYIGINLSLWMFRDVSRQLYQEEPEEVGILVAFENFIMKMKLKLEDKTELERVINLLKSLLLKLWQVAQYFFRGLEIVVSLRLAQNTLQRRLRIRESQEIFGLIPNETKALDDTLQSIISSLSRLLSLLAGVDNLDSSVIGERGFELEVVFDQIFNLRELLTHFRREEYGDDVVWCEIIKKVQENEIQLHSVPVDIASLLAETFYPQLKRCLLTSATLAVGESFDYIMSRWGLDRIEQERVIPQIFGSPFDFPEQALLLIPVYLSSPKEKTFSYDVSKILESVLSIHSRGTMVLFTSHAMLREVYDKIQPVLEKKEIRILGQGLDGSRTALLRIFQEDEKSVLLGTNSFWEGVDVPGSALELLVITKIPFAVPKDPLVEARIERVQAETGNGFLNYSIPEAVMRFRQGFGRLIRSSEDRGGILLLDRRIIQADYGALFLKSLPVEAKICRDEENVIDVLNEWFL